jgi:arginyl-tRNA synthetase
MLELATAYNSFYRDCHVVKDGVVDEFNYAVSEKARELLRNGMIGIGIIPLESM